jgi:hypothetical protein
MKLHLIKLPCVFAERGIYGPDKFSLPKRMRYLHPDAARSLARLEHEYPGKIPYSDVFRSPESSLQAVREKRGAQPPGFSGHNYGLSVDVAIGRATYNLGGSYKRLVAILADHGWHCHRRDGKAGFESWHFNWLGADPAKHLAKTTSAPATWSAAVESMIQSLYEPELRLSQNEIQAALAKLGMYHGAIDGQIGPLSREAIRCFQRAWGLKEDGQPGPKTQRTLAYVTAERY